LIDKMRAKVSDLPICFEGVSFAAGETAVLRDISLTIGKGGPTVILGPNGAGKTTLLKLAMGLVSPSAGRVTWAGGENKNFERRAFVFQRPVMLRRSAAANVAFALRSAGRPAASAKIAQLLGNVGLAAVADRPARRLSGGEQQRLALAKALARDPEVLFLDEPTASLDPAATRAVEDIIRRSAASGVKVLMATHDLGQARRLANDILFLVNGRLAEQAAASVFFVEPQTAEAKRFLAGDLVI
jgi:tungstate transport system ATP-binding protein